MNVLISSGFHWWNAEAHYAAVLARLLRDAGHGVWIATAPGTRNAGELTQRGFDPVAGLPTRTANPLIWLRTAARLRELITRQRIDIINVFRSADVPLVLFAARDRGVPVVRTRGGAQAERCSWFNRRLYGAWTDAIITSCDLIADRLQTRLDLPRANLRTIYFPTDLPCLPSAEVRSAEREHLLAEWGYPADRFFIGVVGRIAPEKGHAHLLTALEILLRAEPKALLAIIDKAEPGDEHHRQALEVDIRRKGLAPVVVWTGLRQDVRRIMGLLDVGVVSSVTSEMNCRVAVEFFSMGTPVVAFPTGALPEVIDSGQSGEVTRHPDPGDLATVLAALAADPNRLAELGRGARDAAQRQFNEPDFLAATLAVFESAVQRGAGSRRCCF